MAADALPVREGVFFWIGNLDRYRLTLLNFASLGLYGIAAALLGVSLARGDRRLPRVAAGTVLVAVILHGLAFAAFLERWNELPLVGLGRVLFTLAMLLAIGSILAATLGQARTVGLVLLPVVVLLMGAAVAIGVVPTGDAVRFQGIWFALHVLFAILGYVGLTVAFGAGLMYLLQFRELKTKHFGAIFRFFPPLETLERLGRRGLMFGFPFLTLALLIGWAWMARFGIANSVGGFKLVWVGLSWLVFVAALLAGTGDGRGGKRGAWASVIGFAIVVMAYLVIRVQTSHGGAFL